MSKTKKQVRVRTKKGKTYMRSMMVNSAEAISRKATVIALKQDGPKSTKPGLVSRLFFRNGRANSKGALASINNEPVYSKGIFSPPGLHPAWQGERIMGQGGSTHSLLAFLVRHKKAELMEPTRRAFNEFRDEVAAKGAAYPQALVRQTAGQEAARMTRSWGSTIQPSTRRDVFDSVFYRDSGARADVGVGMATRYGASSVEHVPHDPNKWVR